MEIFRNSVPTIRFDHPAPNTTVTGIAWTKGDATGTGVPSPGPTGSNYTTTVLPFQDYDGELAIAWTFTITGSGTHTITEYYDVVTPLLPLTEIENIVDDEEWDSDDYTRLESNVRNVIQAHCGQSFGLFSGTKSVYGQGQNALSLPERLLSYDSINGYAFPNLLLIKGDGWYLETKTIGIPDVRADYYGVNTAEVPIAWPYGQSVKEFSSNRRFDITGKWGWNSVPQPVTEAARILINDYSGDTLYRDRYLVSMTAADWRIQFTNGAFAKTGNVRADQLLSQYVLKRGWAVL